MSKYDIDRVIQKLGGSGSAIPDFSSDDSDDKEYSSNPTSATQRLGGIAKTTPKLGEAKTSDFDYVMEKLGSTPKIGGTDKPKTSDFDYVMEKLGSTPNRDDEPGFISRSASALSHGLGTMLGNVEATGSMYAGNRQNVIDIADQQKADRVNAPKQAKEFVEDYRRLVEENEAEGDNELVAATLAAGEAAAKNKEGVLQFVLEQAPNMAPAMAGGWAGFKTGAMAGGAVGGLPGAVIGGGIGAFAGMFLGTALVETGAKGVEAASDGVYTALENNTAIQEGTVKAAVIAGVDLVTLKMGGKWANQVYRGAARTAAQAEAQVLRNAGIDITSRAAIEIASRTSPQVFAAARAAGQEAAKNATTFGMRAKAAALQMGVETIGEGVGEYFGEGFASGTWDASEAVLEAFAGFAMSAAETAYSRGSYQGTYGNAANIAAAGTSVQDQDAKLNTLTGAEYTNKKIAEKANQMRELQKANKFDEASVIKAELKDLVAQEDRKAKEAATKTKEGKRTGKPADQTVKQEAQDAVDTAERNEARDKQKAKAPKPAAPAEKAPAPEVVALRDQARALEEDLLTNSANITRQEVTRKLAEINALEAEAARIEAEAQKEKAPAEPAKAAVEAPVEAPAAPAEPAEAPVAPAATAVTEEAAEAPAEATAEEPRLTQDEILELLNGPEEAILNEQEDAPTSFADMGMEEATVYDEDIDDITPLADIEAAEQLQPTTQEETANGLQEERQNAAQEEITPQPAGVSPRIQEPVQDDVRMSQILDRQDEISEYLDTGYNENGEDLTSRERATLLREDRELTKEREGIKSRKRQALEGSVTISDEDITSAIDEGYDEDAAADLGFEKAPTSTTPTAVEVDNTFYTVAELGKRKKDDLVALANSRGISLAGKKNKADYVSAILKQQNAQEDAMDATEDGDFDLTLADVEVVRGELASKRRLHAFRGKRAEASLALLTIKSGTAQAYVDAMLKKLSPNDPLHYILTKLNGLGIGNIPVKFLSTDQLRAIIKEDKLVGGVYVHGTSKEARYVGMNKDILNDASVIHFIHELIHAATVHKLTTDNKFALKLEALRIKAANALKDSGVEYYGLKNVNEFVSELFTNASFQLALSKIDAGGTTENTNTLWDRFMELLHRVMDIPYNKTSVLYEAMNLSRNVFHSFEQGNYLDVRKQDYIASVEARLTGFTFSANEIAAMSAEDKNLHLDRRATKVGLKPVLAATSIRFRQIVNNVRSKIVASNVDIIYVNNEKELPENLQNVILAGKSGKGWIVRPADGGKSTIYLIGDQIAKYADDNGMSYETALKKTFTHELVAHFGLYNAFKEVFGESNSYANFLDKEGKRNPKLVRSAASALIGQGRYTQLATLGKKPAGAKGVEVTVLHNNNQVPGWIPEANYAQLLDEYIAYRSERMSDGRLNQELANESFFKKVMNMIRHALRKIGITNLSDRDIDEMLMLSHDRLYAPTPEIDSKLVGLTGETQLKILLDKLRGMSPLPVSEGDFVAASQVQASPQAQVVAQKYQDKLINRWTNYVRNGYLTGAGRVNLSYTEKLSEKISEAARKSPIGRRWAALSNLNHQQLYKQLVNELKGNIKQVEDLAQRLLDGLKGITPAQNSIVMAYFSEANTEQMRLDEMRNAGMKEEVIRDLIAAKNAIEGLGGRLVEMGKLNPETYNKNRRAYLPSVYYKYIENHIGYGMKLSAMDYLKKKGLLNESSQDLLGRIDQADMIIPRFIGLLGRDVAILESQKVVNALNKEFKLGWVAENTKYPVTREIDGKVQKVKMSESDMLSELDVLRQIMANERDKLPMHRSIAGEKALEEQILHYEKWLKVAEKDRLNAAEQALLAQGIKPEDITEESLTKFLDQEYKRIPNKPEFGFMRNKLVHKGIYNDYVDMAEIASSKNEFMNQIAGTHGAVARATQFWKASKVILNIPSAPIRNFMGATMQLWGANNVSYVETVAEMVKQFTLNIKALKAGNNIGKTRAWVVVESRGLTGATFSAAELDMFTNAELIKLEQKLKTAVAKANGQKNPLSKIATMSMFAQQAIEPFARFYGYEESAFKAAAVELYLRRWEKDNQPLSQASTEIRDAVYNEAAVYANDTIFDYTQTAPFVKLIRRFPLGGSPFFTFAYKAGPKSVENFIAHPVKHMMVMSMGYALMELALTAFDWDDDEYDWFLKHGQKQMEDWGTIYILPWRADDGKPMFINLEYLFPWSQWWNAAKHITTETLDGSPREGIKKAIDDFGFLSGPIVDTGYSLYTGKYKFGGKDISPPTTTNAAGEFNDFARWLVSMWFPPILTHQGALGKAMDAYGIGPTPFNLGNQYNKFMEERLEPSQVVGSALGVNTYKKSAAELQNSVQVKFEMELKELSTQLSKILRDPNLNSRPAERMSKVKDIQTKIKLKRMEHAKFYREDATLTKARKLIRGE